MQIITFIFFSFCIIANSISYAITFEEIVDQLNYLTAQDMVISKNLANANTPEYLPQNVKKPIRQNIFSLDITDDMHIPFNSSPEIELIDANIIELKPNGNGVTIEDELAKKNENALNFKEIATLFYKNKSMIQLALSGNKQ